MKELKLLHRQGYQQTRMNNIQVMKHKSIIIKATYKVNQNGSMYQFMLMKELQEQILKDVLVLIK